MTSYKPMIVWQKWVDPFGKNAEDVEWPGYKDHDVSDDFEDIEEESSTIDSETDETGLNKMISSSNPIQVIATPMGIIPYNEHTACSKIFNFWVGHTNFNITSKIAKTIEDSEGVEILDVFTRYRFRIAIGKLFEDKMVMKKINDNVYEILG
jgi:hypothetical protein